MTLSFKEHLDIFEAGRPAMRENNRDLYRLGELAEGEFGEFATALLDYLSHPDQDTAQELAQEIADVGLYLEQILRMIGSDLLTEMIDKIAYNTMRFSSRMFSEKQYKEAYFESKAEAKSKGLKQTYYAVPHVIYDHTHARQAA